MNILKMILFCCDGCSCCSDCVGGKFVCVDLRRLVVVRRGVPFDRWSVCCFCGSVIDLANLLYLLGLLLTRLLVR